MRNGSGMNPIITQQYVHAAHDRRMAHEASQSMAGLFAQAALRAFREYQAGREEQSRWRTVDGVETSGGRDVQYTDGNYSVKVLNGYSRDSDSYTTDVVVTDRHTPGNLHMHVVFDEDGKIITEHWKQHGKIIQPPR